MVIETKRPISGTKGESKTIHGGENRMTSTEGRGKEAIDAELGRVTQWTLYQSSCTLGSARGGLCRAPSLKSLWLLQPLWHVAPFPSG